MVDEAVLRRLESLGTILRDITGKLEQIHGRDQPKAAKPEAPAWVQAASMFTPWVGKEWEKANPEPAAEPPPPMARFTPNHFDVGQATPPLARAVADLPTVSAPPRAAEPISQPAAPGGVAQSNTSIVAGPPPMSNSLGTANRTPVQSNPVAMFGQMILSSVTKFGNQMPSLVSAANSQTPSASAVASNIARAETQVTGNQTPTERQPNTYRTPAQVIEQQSNTQPNIAQRPIVSISSNLSKGSEPGGVSLPPASLAGEIGKVATPSASATAVSDPVQSSATEREHASTDLRELVTSIKELIAALKAPKPSEPTERPGLHEGGRFVPSMVGSQTERSQMPIAPGQTGGGSAPIAGALDAARGRALMAAMLGRGS